MRAQLFSVSRCCTLSKAANSDDLGKDWVDVKALLSLKYSNIFIRLAMPIVTTKRTTSIYGLNLAGLCKWLMRVHKTK